MTNYHITPTSLPSLDAQEAKAQRKLVLDAVRKRRYQSEQERRKRQQEAYSKSSDFREYQEMLKETAE